ncbi:hypothetical protein HZA56_13340 [Candidatus Poribacteria bacterium]|nr:hypothetical protein [Candidatus Poribacteria bacterium]
MIATALVASAGASVLAQHDDPTILARAIEKQLGKKTNTGAPRVVQIKKGVKNGKNVLGISLNANNSPTRAGLQIGVFNDAAKVCKILKGWGWPARVESVMIGEYYSPPNTGTNNLTHLIFAARIASGKISETDWDAFDARNIPEIMDDVEVYEPIR